MQRTIRILRIALPIAFVAFVLLIALSWNRNRVKKEKNVIEPIAATRTGDKPQAESKGFEDTQTVDRRRRRSNPIPSRSRAISPHPSASRRAMQSRSSHRAHGSRHSVPSP
jgi:hypothetical protein